MGNMCLALLIPGLRPLLTGFCCLKTLDLIYIPGETQTHGLILKPLCGTKIKGKTKKYKFLTERTTMAFHMKVAKWIALPTQSFLPI